jgi:urease accessory protein
VKAQAAIVAVADGRGGTRLTTLRSQVPLVLRRAPDAVYLVAGAGGPLGGDELRLTIDVGAGATLVVRSVAATVAQPSAVPAESAYDVIVSVGPGATFVWQPEPTVIATGARHAMRMRVSAAADARVLVREGIVLGRYAEAGGAVTTSLSVDVGGRPLLRQTFALGGEDPVARGSGVTAGHRAVGSVLVAEPGLDGLVATADDGVAVLPLAGPGVLVTALAQDSATLARRLDAGLARFVPVAVPLKMAL